MRNRSATRLTNESGRDIKEKWCWRIYIVMVTHPITQKIQRGSNPSQEK